MQQAHIFISGTVQGVGFRYFVKNNARKLGVSGWVQNTPDNKVEAIFQGEKKVVEQMIALCKKGPFLAEVKEVQVDWEEGEKFSEFLIH
jgi:acylphosphatase